MSIYEVVTDKQIREGELKTFECRHGRKVMTCDVCTAEEVAFVIEDVDY